MTKAKMQYVAFFDEDDESVMHVAEVGKTEYKFLTNQVLPSLKPLSAEQYMVGPAGVLHTFAKFSYVLFKGDLYWCIEWTPGLVIVRIRKGGELSWAAFRSPNPQFGGRKATRVEIASFDCDAEDPLDNIVFYPWNAALERNSDFFKPASRRWCVQYELAIDHLNALGETMATRFGGDIDGWRENCQKNIAAFAGNGIPLML